MSEMTVEEMGARLGLERTSISPVMWVNDRGQATVYHSGHNADLSGGKWVSWKGVGGEEKDREEHPTERDAMLRLYRLRFPEVAPEPAPVPVKRSNVEIVDAAIAAFLDAPGTGVRETDNACAVELGKMRAEAFVKDQMEVERG